MSINELDGIRDDVESWIQNFVESPSEFYDNNFPVCPYAQSARLKKLHYLACYHTGNPWSWLSKQIQALLYLDQYQVALFVLPPLLQNGVTRLQLYLLNRRIIREDYFALMGSTVGLVSRYPWWWGSGEYTVVGVNRLSRVLPAVENLKKQGYYNYWSQHHFEQIVNYRQRMYERYRKQG